MSWTLHFLAVVNLVVGVACGHHGIVCAQRARQLLDRRIAAPWDDGPIPRRLGWGFVMLAAVLFVVAAANIILGAYGIVHGAG